MEADPAQTDAESPDEDQDLSKDEAHDLMDVDGLEGLGRLADELEPRPLKLIAATAIAEAIDELTGGSTTAYVNTNGSGINRVAVITDGYTVRVLMLTVSWKWRGPITPDDPEGYLNDRGYIPAPEVNDGD
jgi:hypothetical protein